MTTRREDNMIWSESFAATHLTSAEYFVSEVKRIEEDFAFELKDGPKSKDQLKTENIHNGLVIYSIIGAVAYLDSLINEVYDKHHKFIREFQADIYDDDESVINDDEFVQSFEKYSKIEAIPFSRRSTLEKYNIFIVLSDGSTFDKGKSPYQEALALIKSRNYFIHYEPELYITRDEQNHIEHDIGSSLQGKFELNPLVPSDRPYFPHRCLSYGYADWAVRVVKDFTTQFFDRCSITPNPTPATTHVLDNE